jgi:hypothetical protein
VCIKRREAKLLLKLLCIHAQIKCGVCVCACVCVKRMLVASAISDDVCMQPKAYQQRNGERERQRERERERECVCVSLCDCEYMVMSAQDCSAPLFA